MFDGLPSAAWIESTLESARHDAILAVIRQHPEMRLGDLARSPAWESIAAITIGDLIAAPVESIDGSRLAEAQRARGTAYDGIVLAVIVDSSQPVGAAYLRARVGGPRWKLLGALRRLIESGQIQRHGVTSATTYEALP